MVRRTDGDGRPVWSTCAFNVEGTMRSYAENLQHTAHLSEVPPLRPIVAFLIVALHPRANLQQRLFLLFNQLGNSLQLF